MWAPLLVMNGHKSDSRLETGEVQTQNVAVRRHLDEGNLVARLYARRCIEAAERKIAWLQQYLISFTSLFF